MMILSDQIKKYLLDKGADLVGFGDLSEIPEDIRVTCHMEYVSQR